MGITTLSLVYRLNILMVSYEDSKERRKDVTRIIEIIKWILTEVKNMMEKGQKIISALDQLEMKRPTD
jgi:hypothetical protein